MYNRNGYNYFWSVDNSTEVLDKLNNVNNPSSIHTYDFSTLYTNLPLDLVRNGGGGGLPLQHRRLSCHSFLNHLTVYTSLEVVAGWTLEFLVFFIGGSLWFSSRANNTGFT